ncbi:hypothetical protein [Varunaivibrio sulfuroxidans]|nr:hypothetical protein [Varunaivibrio sulfuroxidans]WES31761.1 hypothetical protein P3M64_05180 [Varunaivibrio sulfuroxidans]
MSKKVAKLSPEEANDARERALRYEASMAIEGIRLTHEERVFADKVDAEGLNYEEAIERTIAWLEETYSPDGSSR